MPQLMPLNWVMSSMMCLLMVVSMSMIYSIKMNSDLQNGNFVTQVESTKTWYW